LVEDFPFGASVLTALPLTAEMENRSTGFGAPQMSGQTPAESQFKENAHGAAGALGSSTSDAMSRGRDAVGAATNDAMSSAGRDLQSLQADLNRLKDTVSKFMGQAAEEATKSAREASVHVAGRVSDVASSLAETGGAMASTATGQARTLSSELENMARRNPIGVMAGAVMVGILIGMLGRRS
jgi:ElaB/YqjD/DUF883 family membrane-anchored ribosome-binding protein